MSTPFVDPFSLSEHEEGGVRVLEVVGAGEWMGIHADPQSGLAALRLN